MRRKYSPLTIIILILIAIGIFSNPYRYLIPIIVVGIIVLLYFFPPSRWRIKRGYPKTTSKYSKSSRTEAPKKKGRFRVIQGSKPDDRNDPPPYH